MGLGLTTACSGDNVIIWLIASVCDHRLVVVVCGFVNIAECPIGQVCRVATVHNYKKAKKRDELKTALLPAGLGLPWIVAMI